jgi:hypothetical protein
MHDSRESKITVVGNQSHEFVFKVIKDILGNRSTMSRVEIVGLPLLISVMEH